MLYLPHMQFDIFANFYSIFALDFMFIFPAIPPLVFYVLGGITAFFGVGLVLVYLGGFLLKSFDQFHEIKEPCPAPAPDPDPNP